MIRFRTGLVFLVVATFLLAATVAQAEIKVFRVEGTVDAVRDNGDLIATSVNDRWSLTYSFDTQADPIAVPFGKKEYAITATDFVAGPDFYGFGDSAHVFVYDDTVSGADLYDIGAYLPVWNDLRVIAMSIGMTDTDGTIFDNMDMPATPPDIAELEQTYFNMSGWNIGQTESFSIDGTVDTFIEIPEPSAAMLLLLGSLAVAQKSRRM